MRRTRLTTPEGVEGTEDLIDAFHDDPPERGTALHGIKVVSIPHRSGDRAAT
jgi:hypothetical protein